MPSFQWIPDIPSGVIRNHALSQDMRYASIPNTKGLQCVKPVGGYGRKMGETVTIPRARNIAEPTSPILTRNQKIPIATQAITTQTITVQKLGQGVEFDEEAEILSKFDPKDFIQVGLMKQLRLVLDTLAFAAFKRCQIRYAPTSDSGGTFTTDAGSTAQTATNNIRVAHIKIIRDYLASTIHTEPYEMDFYMGLAATKFLRGIKDDSEFLAWRQYLDPDMAFYYGEVGAIEKIRLCEVTHDNGLDNTVGTGSVLGEAVIFGEEPVVSAIALDPEIRLAIPGNFGLQKAIAWYAILRMEEVWDTSNDGEAKIIYVTSSTTS